MADKSIMKDALSSMRKQLRDRTGSKRIFPATPSVTVHVTHNGAAPEGMETEEEEEGGPMDSPGSSIFSKESGHDMGPLRKRR